MGWAGIGRETFLRLADRVKGPAGGAEKPFYWEYLVGGAFLGGKGRVVLSLGHLGSYHPSASWNPTLTYEVSHMGGDMCLWKSSGLCWEGHG